MYRILSETTKNVAQYDTQFFAMGESVRKKVGIFRVNVVCYDKATTKRKGESK